MKFVSAALLVTIFAISGATNTFAVSLNPSVRRNQEPDNKAKDKEEEKLPGIEKFTKQMKLHEGYFNFFWDESKGKVYLHIPLQRGEFLYVHALATGLGSNPVGLDRGQLGDQKVVRFDRIGPKVLLSQRNLRFRAVTDNELERSAVEQSFASSTLWGGKVVAEDETSYLTDVTDLLLSDMHDVVGTLKSSEQGDFKVDEKRSAVFLPRCKAFPENTELEASLTFSGSKPGRYVRQTTPTPNSITLRQHHSFIKLPDNNYQPRVYDVRSPCLSITFADYASPLDQPLEHRWILRHRLQKQNPDAEVSEPVEPIVYYVDAGAPAQIQEALIEGASWWNEAYESAGFKDAFQVKLLPPDADPLDVRYNVIQWVHRSTRGWSYGGSVIDPRTGEIIKGHVTLGSLRVRQDQLLVNSLSGRTSNLNCACCGIGGIPEESTLIDFTNTKQSALEVALARIRQLSAHEVGHTIGFVHNFAASTYGDRESVMDYPAPRVKINENGNLDFSDAYGVGIGEWDKVAVQFAYQEFSQDQESKRLNEILVNAAKNHVFVTDADARPAHAAHPLGNLWDNGSNPVEELEHVLKVRRIALKQFDATKLPKSTTSADVAQYFTPLYLHHRYQVQAVGKMIGGQIYRYGYVSDQDVTQDVPAESQMDAFNVLLSAIEPSQLNVDDQLIRQISPRPYSSIRDPEILPSWSGRSFDVFAPAKVAIEMTVSEILQPQRMNRLVQQSRMDSTYLNPAQLVSKLIEFAYNLEPSDENEKTIVSLIKESLADRQMAILDNTNNSFHVRDAVHRGLKQMMIRESTGNSNTQYRSTLYRRIKLHLERPASVMPKPTSPDTPPGSPIGGQ